MSQIFSVEKINSIIQHYLRVYKKYGNEDIVQNVWVYLLKYSRAVIEEENWATNEESRKRIYNLIRSFIRHNIRDELKSNKRFATQVVSAQVLKNACNGDGRVFDRVVPISKPVKTEEHLYQEHSDILYSISSGIDHKFFFNCFLNGFTNQDLLYQFSPHITIKDISTIRTLFMNTYRHYYKTNINIIECDIHNIHLEWLEMEKSLKIYKNNQNNLFRPQKYHAGYNFYCYITLSIILKPKVIDIIIDLINQGLTDTQIYTFFVAYPPTSPFRNCFRTKPKATFMQIKYVRHILTNISPTHAEAYLHSSNNPDTLEKLEAYLNKHDIKCKIVWGENNKYILVENKCKQCGGRKKIQIFEDEQTQDFVFCCMKCRDKGELHELYKLHKGKRVELLLQSCL